MSISLRFHYLWGFCGPRASLTLMSDCVDLLILEGGGKLRE